MPTIFPRPTREQWETARATHAVCLTSGNLKTPIFNYYFTSRTAALEYFLWLPRDIERCVYERGVWKSGIAPGMGMLASDPPPIFLCYFPGIVS